VNKAERRHVTSQETYDFLMGIWVLQDLPIMLHCLDSTCGQSIWGLTRESILQSTIVHNKVKIPSPLPVSEIKEKIIIFL